MLYVVVVVLEILDFSFCRFLNGRSNCCTLYYYSSTCSSVFPSVRSLGRPLFEPLTLLSSDIEKYKDENHCGVQARHVDAVRLVL